MPLTQVSSRLIEDTLRYVLGASGTDHYTFTGKGLTGAVNDPTLTLSRGHTYIFENRSGGHPFYIKTSIANGGTNDAYNTGVTNNGGGNGTEIIFTVPHDAPDTLYYQCSSHSSMNGQLNIAGSVADGSITTAKLADDAVNAAKIADGAIDNSAKIGGNIINNTHMTDNAIGTNEIAANAVTTAKIADDAVTSAKIGANQVTTVEITVAGVQTVNIQDGAVTDAKINSMAASKLTGALPAISGASLTGISAGISMADQWRVSSEQSNVYGTNQITANWERNDNTSFTGIGSAMTESSGTFTFPVTGIYLIRAIAQFRGQNDVHGQNERQHLGIQIRATTNNSSYTVIAKCFDSSGNKFGNPSDACVVTEVIFDVTDVTTHKVQMWHNTVGSAYLKAESGSQITGMTFIKLGDT